MCCSTYHGGHHAPGAEQYPPEPERECQCDQGLAGVACCGARTSTEDNLCNRCRRNCLKVLVDGVGVVGVGGNNAAPITVTVDA